MNMLSGESKNTHDVRLTFKGRGLPVERSTSGTPGMREVRIRDKVFNWRFRVNRLSPANPSTCQLRDALALRLLRSKQLAASSTTNIANEERLPRNAALVTSECPRPLERRPCLWTQFPTGRAASSLGPDRAERCDRLTERRDRYGQGSVRALHSSKEHPRRRTFGPGQLRRDSRDPSRVRAVRLCARRIHRRGDRTPGSSRTGSRGNAL